MFFTINTILYALAGALLILLTGSVFPPVKTFWIYNAILLIAIVADVLMTPKKNAFTIERNADRRLSLGAKNTIQIKITNHSRYRLKIKLKDEYPLRFESEESEMETVVDGRAFRRTSYDVAPTRRGEYKFGAVHVRIHGILGLAGRQLKYDIPEKVKVYPNVKEISTYQTLARKNRLLEAGLKPTRIYGVGTDFEFLREYQPDDEYRKINWKATARRSKLITAQYQVERSQNIMLVIEKGRMMLSRINKITKFDHAINSALLLAYVAMEKGDNVGLLVFSDGIHAYLPPKRGKRQLNMIIESLYNLEPQIVEPDYGKAIRYLSLKNRKRSLVIMFTDLIDTDVSKSVVVYGKALYPAHLPLCVAISDPELFKESEQYPSDRVTLYRKAVAEDLIHQREQVKKVLQRGGVETLDVPPDKLTPGLITRYLSIKARNRL